ncbi:MAG: hypothetical protein JXQ29_09200 [Planctomycetes bacterium]|nr:hypothetical protein [Planctomycetota bacterium]
MNERHAPLRGLWAPPEDAAEICIGISTCLLGQKVRFDGGHKREGIEPDGSRPGP